MAYIKINNAYFDDSSGQLRAVSDPATLRGLQTGAIVSSTQPAISGGSDRFANELTLPSGTQDQTLPDAKTNPLLDFKDTLSKVIDLARNKRNKLSLDFMGGVAPAGTMMASDFNSILSNMNRASEGFTEDTLERAFPEEESVSTKVSTDKLDNPLSANELRVMIDTYGIDPEDLPPGSTMRDIQTMQTEKFISDNIEADKEEIVGAVTENTNLDENEVISIWEKLRRTIAVPVNKLLGGSSKEETTDEDFINSL